MRVLQFTEGDMTVQDLRNILEGLPDNLPVILPIICEDDTDVLLGFRPIRTAGILSVAGEENVLCLSSSDQLSLLAQLELSSPCLDDSIVCVASIEPKQEEPK